jgi:putative addiction module CopG family antidote
MYSIPTEVFMHVRFADVDENFIKTEVQSGFYNNETELVRDAVCRMREEKERARHFQEAVARGIQAIDPGETVVLTPDLLHEIKQDAIRKAKNDEPYSQPDAIPKNTHA